jgi:hypothetical protein
MSTMNFRVKAPVATIMEDVSGHATNVQFVYHFDLEYEVPLPSSYFDDILINGIDLSGDQISCDVSGSQRATRQNYFHDSFASIDDTNNVWKIVNDTSSTLLHRLGYDLKSGHVPSAIDKNLPTWVEVIIMHTVEKAIDGGDMSGVIAIDNVSPDSTSDGNFLGLYKIIDSFILSLGTNGQTADKAAHALNALIEDCSGQTDENFFKSTVGIWVRQMMANYNRYDDLLDIAGSIHTFKDMLQNNDYIEVLFIVGGNGTDSSGIMLDNTHKSLGAEDCHPTVADHLALTNQYNTTVSTHGSGEAVSLADPAHSTFEHEPIGLRLMYKVSVS